MDLFFKDRKIERLCSNEKRQLKKLGKVGARRLQARLLDLRIALTLEELRKVPGRLHELTGNRKGQLAIDLDHPFRLIIEPTVDPPPQKATGGIDWKQVDAVTIIEIKDYH
ncbi:MAG: killer suppression protein [Bacteroidota bacterium]